MIATPTRHKFTIESLRLMEQAGVFPPDQRMELLSGEIIDMSPINAPHAHCVTRLTRFFYQRLSLDDYLVSVQNPVQLSLHSLPQPDIIIAHNKRDAQDEMHIQASDVVLLIEVSDSSYDYDRHSKFKEYALAAIPEYWIVNLLQQQIEVYTQPQEGRYTQTKIRKQAFETSLGPRLSPNEMLPRKS